VSDALLEDELLDLDYGDDEAPDPNADAPLIDAPRYQRTEASPYHEDLPVMWAAVRAGRKTKAKIDPGGSSRVVHSSPGYSADPPPAMVRLVKRLEAHGWQWRMLETRVRVEDLLYVGRTEDHDPGDVRTPEHTRRHWFLQAVLVSGETRVAWFKAAWERVGDGGNKFDAAFTWDAVTGSAFEPGATGFDEWVSIFAPKPPTKARKAKPAPEPAAEEGFWIAREM
jgi:hypothetical protein